jgi:hypothetical protein
MLIAFDIKKREDERRRGQEGGGQGTKLYL